MVSVFFFFQAEDGIRDGRVTGVQTCALPISRPAGREGLPPDVVGKDAVPRCRLAGGRSRIAGGRCHFHPQGGVTPLAWSRRSEERRVGKECRSRRSTYN